MRRTSVMVAFVFLLVIFYAVGLPAATIGTVIPIVGQASDLAYDSQRGLVYVSNFSQSRIEIYSVGSGRLVSGITLAGLSPASIAMSPDRTTLWIACQGSNLLASINLNNQAETDFKLSARPDAVAVGSDGRVLILGSTGLMRFDPATGAATQLATPVTAVPAPGTGATGPLPQGYRANLVASANGNYIIGSAATSTAAAPPMRLFVYEVASGSVLRNRLVTGLGSIVSVSPDGTRFMAGPFLFDTGLTTGSTGSLTILGRTASLPATTTTLSGGSAFSPDGNSVYASFATLPAVAGTPLQIPVNPLNTNQPALGNIIPGSAGSSTTVGVLQVLRASSLAPQLGLRLPEAITSKIIATNDGQNAFALSTSGMLAIPVGQLTRVPVLDVDTTNVVLTADLCSRTVATANVQIRNLGSGRMTFQAIASNPAAGAGTAAPILVTLNQRTGVAPATLTLSFNPGAVTSASLGTGQYIVTLVSPEAVNVEPAILVSVNFKNVDQRGTIVPFSGLGSDILLDQARNRIYIANFMRDQIEVFSIASQSFLPPIRVGNQPFSMAMPNPSTLVVANSGGEDISVVDLNAMQETTEVEMVTASATPVFPRYIAASSNAVLFSTMSVGLPGTAPGTGNIWQLSLATGTAFPRPNLGATANTVGGKNLLVSAADLSGIAIADSAGTGTLRLYDPVADTFPIARTGVFTAGFRGTASSGIGADGTPFFLVDNQAYNSVLTPRGPLTTTGTTTAFGVSAAGTDGVRIQAVDAADPVQQIQRVNMTALQVSQQFALPEAVMDITPGNSGTAALPRAWPPASIGRLFGANGQTQLLRTGIVADSSSTAYALTVSGLSIISLTPAAGSAPAFSASGLVNGASFKTGVAPGSIISLFGTNLAATASANTLPLPISLGGVCVTVNEVNLPLFYTSPTQINAQLPPNLSAGRVTLTVRSQATARQSSGVAVSIVAAAPGVFAADTANPPHAALLHAEDYSPVTPDNPGKRDHSLILYTTGLGAVTPQVQGGQPASDNPLSTINPSNVTVGIGGHPMIVTFAGLAPGFVGLYQINFTVPGDRVQGDTLPVVVQIGSASSPVCSGSDPTAPCAGVPIASIH